MKKYVFIFFLLIFLASSGGHTDVWDGKAYYAYTENILVHGSFNMNRELSSPEIIKFDINKYFNYIYNWNTNSEEFIPPPDIIPVPIPPLYLLLSIPLFLIDQIIEFPEGQFLPFFFNSIILALVATVVYAFSREIYDSKKIGFVLAVIVSVCSAMWPYTSSMFLQPLVGLVIISSLYFIYIENKKKVKISPLLGGLFAGAISLAHSAYVIVEPGILIYGLLTLRKDKKRLVQFVIGAISTISIQLYLNYTRFESVTNFGYGIEQNLSRNVSLEGLYALFASPGYGLAVMFPLFILVPYAIYKMYNVNKKFSIIVIYLITTLWIFFGTREDPGWIGLGAWGVRYLIPIIPMMVLMLGILIKQKKTSINIMIIILAIFGFTINLIGALVWYETATDYSANAITLAGEDLSIKIWRYYEWDFKYIVPISALNVLTTNFIDEWQSPHVYWKTCNPDNFIYCNYGIIPIFVIIGSIFIIWNRKIHKNLKLLRNF